MAEIDLRRVAVKIQLLAKFTLVVFVRIDELCFKTPVFGTRKSNVLQGMSSYNWLFGKTVVFPNRCCHLK